MNNEANAGHRRRFLAQLGGLAAGVAGLNTIARAQGAQGAQGRSRRARTHDHPHDAFMRNLNGTHRQLFHSVSMASSGPPPGLMVQNYLDAYQAAYGADMSHVNAVLGVHGTAIGFALNDAIWAKYPIGREANVLDAQNEPRTANPFVSGSGTSVTALQQRGVVIIACDTALRLTSARWARAMSLVPGEVHQELRANLLPGVIPVPALVVAMQRAQEAGFTYVRMM